MVAGDGRKRSAEEERRLMCEGFLPLEPLVGMWAEGERRILKRGGGIKGAGEGGRKRESEMDGRREEKGGRKTTWTVLCQANRTQQPSYFKY